MDGDAPGGEPEACRALRADAERNRAAILAAATEVFAERGLDAPLEEIAGRAGVGIATLYRRFPCRERLVADALASKVGQYAEAAEQARTVSDPWRAFSGFVERICELQATDKGLAELLSMALPPGEPVERIRSHANSQAEWLIGRAQVAGALRADFTVEDLLLLLIASAAVARVTAEDAPRAWRRFVALALDGCRRRDGLTRLPPAPPAGGMPAAMRRFATERGCGERARGSRSG